MKNRVVAFLLPFVLAVHTAIANDGVPEPGLIVYGQVYSLAAPTQTVAIGAIKWNPAPGGSGTIVSASNYSNPPETVPSESTGSYYIARVPFESVNPAGLALTGSSSFDLLTTLPDPHQLGLRITPLGSTTEMTAQVKAINGTPQPGNPTFFNWSDISANASAPRRGRLIRVDLLVDSAPIDAFSLWMADFIAAGKPGSEQTADPDGDGMTNEEEYAAKTNPLDEDSYVKIVPFSRIDSNTGTLSWNSSAGEQYTIEFSTSSSPDKWTALGVFVGTAGTTTISDIANVEGHSKRTFRVRTTP